MIIPGDASSASASGARWSEHERPETDLNAMCRDTDERDEDGRLVIRCHVNQRLSPLIVAKEMAAFGMLDAAEPQRWFVEQCVRADFVESGREKTLGDCLYYKNLLHRLAKALSEGSRVMEDVVADAMGATEGIAAEAAGSGSGTGRRGDSSAWMNKVYFYGRRGGAIGDRCAGVLRIASHVNMFAGSTGQYEWDAGYLLAEFILNSPALFEGRALVEIGCGTGMATIMMAQLRREGMRHLGEGDAGLPPIVCTDGDRDTVENCEQNLRLNGIDAHMVSCSTWTWEEGMEGLRAADRERVMASGRAVVMVGADLLYDPEIIPVIVPLMAAFLKEAPAGSCVYLSTRRRSELTLEKFLRAVEAEATLQMVEEEAFWEASRSDPSFVGFQHVHSLDEAKRSRSIILHRIVSSL